MHTQINKCSSEGLRPPSEFLVLTLFLLSGGFRPQPELVFLEDCALSGEIRGRDVFCLLVLFFDFASLVCVCVRYIIVGVGVLFSVSPLVS